MNLQQLYYFRTVAELEHFTRAAETLMVSQPSLSHAIGDLEKELGVQLFERQGRNVRLTKYGAILLEYVVKALAILDEGRRKLEDFIRPEQGTISLSYFSSLDEFIPYLVAKYYEETSNLHTLFQFTQASNADIESRLLDGSADLALGTPLDSRELACHKVGEHNIVLIVPRKHPLAERDSVDLSALGDERFITYGQECRIRSYIDEVFGLCGISPRIVTETTHDTIIYSSVAAGFGVGLVPEPLGMQPYHVKVLPIENALPKREIFLFWRDVRYLSPAVQQFRDFIIGRGLQLDTFRSYLRRK